jgi:methyl-accepting chemotaxis protein
MPIAISQTAQPAQAQGAPAPDQRSASSSSRRDGFFRHHGLWAPGVRLFRRLGFNAKAAIITLTFLLPIALLSWNYFRAQADQIAFSAKELDGTAYAHAAHALLPLLLEARSAPGPMQATQATALREALAALQAREAALGDALGTRQAHDRVQKQALSLLSTPPAHGDEAFARVGDTLQAVIALITVASDGSNLTLDPDIDTYYLMDASMFKLPAMIDAAGQIGTLGAQVLNAGRSNPSAARRLIEQVAILRSSLDGMGTGIDKAQAYNPSLQARIQADPARRAVSELVRQLEASALHTEGVRGQAASLQATSRLAVAAMAELNESVVSALDSLIAARVGRAVSARNLTFVLVCISLLLALYLFTAFKKVLHGGLREVSRHIDQMRDGDLTTRPRAWGADEAAGLIHSINDMQGAMRHLVAQVRRSADGIVVASHDIATGAQALNQRTEASASHLESTASAMEEISAGVRHNADAVSESALMAQCNAQAAQRGGEVVQQVVAGMQRIDQAAQRIHDIIGTIDAIAFQTNILALNAAVEAARAGEQGRGFAVVAAEVRSLANRTTAAAREVKHLITDSVQQVHGGMDVATQAGRLMSEVVQASTQVTQRLSEAVTGATEQSRGIQATTRSVQELDSATQQNVALVEETAAAAQALRTQAHALVAHVARFKLPATP